MPKKKVVIVGGGISGLSAGIYLQKNGFKTVVLEKNGVPGGVSVGWKRNDFIFDGSAEWLAGSHSTANMHYMLKEVISLDEMEIINHEEFIVVEHDSKQFIVYRDADKLRSEMLRFAPEDKKIITEFTDAIKKMGTFNLDYKNPPELMSLPKLITFPFLNFRFIKFFLKWKRMRIRDFAAKFKNKFLSNVIIRIFPEHEHFSIFSIIATLGWMNIKSGGYVIGGSNKIAEAISEHYKRLGGNFILNKQVESVDVKNGVINSVITSDNKIFSGDYFILSTDMVYSHEKLLKSKYISPKKLDNMKKRELYSSIFMVSLGVNSSFSDIKFHNYVIDIPSVDAGGEVANRMMVRITSFDRTFAPKGKTAVSIRLRLRDPEFWSKLREEDYKEYVRQKKVLGEKLIALFFKHFNITKDAIEIIDIATPATYIRYNNVYRGSFQGWAPTPKFVGKSMQKKIKGLANIYFTGQAVWPAGGIPGVIRVARHTSQIICKREGIPFKA